VLGCGRQSTSSFTARKMPSSIDRLFPAKMMGGLSALDVSCISRSLSSFAAALELCDSAYFLQKDDFHPADNRLSRKPFPNRRENNSYVHVSLILGQMD
jgi:hypothetical protein